MVEIEKEDNLERLLHGNEGFHLEHLNERVAYM